MTSVVLPKPLNPRPARDIVVATRMPPPPKSYGSNPFDTVGHVTADCGVEDCGYHVQGERKDVGIAIRQHHRLFHSESISVVLLNHARQ